MHETVELERRGAAAIVRLNRPQALNAWNAALGVELLAAVRAVADDDAVRAVCVTGAGRAFSSGADLRDMSARRPGADGGLDVHTTLTTVYHPIIMGLRTMPKPVVAAINGPAVGIGCSLALSCDVLVATESAYLSLDFARIGLAPDGGGLALASARAGAGRATAMAMLGRTLAAPEALRAGLVDEVHPDADFARAVDAIVDRLAAGATKSFAAAKRQLNAWLYAGLEHQLELEARIQQELVGSLDFAEGIAAFASRRTPEFQGE